MTETVDYISAGAGSAGAVLAARLTEDPAVRVVLIEAGKDRTASLFVNMPVGSFAMIGNPRFSWSYRTEPDPSLGGRTIGWTGGRMLGGSSAINGMVYVRGNRQDYARWVEKGATGWDWPDMLPYFLKSENYQGEPSQWHGSHGPLRVGLQNTRHSLADAVIAAFVANGVPHRPEYCDGDQSGVYENLTTAPGGRRCSTAHGYLADARTRPNLRTMTDTLVDRVLTEQGRAIGVRVLRGGQVQDIAGNTVVLSSGAIQSPAILMRSGIGPGAALTEMGIPVVSDRPVGQNLQDHCGVGLAKFVDVPTYNSPFSPLTIASNLARWVLTRKRPMASAAVQVMAGVRSSPDVEEPDIAVSFLPLAIDLASGRPQMHKRPGISVGGNCMRPDSRGELRLATRDPNEQPIIDHRHLGDYRDVVRLRNFLKFLDKVMASKPLADHVTGNISPAVMPRSDDEWDAMIRETAVVGYHSVGTCRMGGEDAVVDPELRVRGVDNLRVIDASVMPLLVSGNTNAATIAIAERGAEMLLRAAA
ncbi:GMC family oxidoreductase [Sphingopyxis flava]|uniref:Choline dehydrogenase n=1 Tax=Sphingopyxis flava TaxID=1507287 RepID=A0A1T5E4Z2_9SPHN|nr:GMC family oxidoreductase N-terminal domain-containing protein [Sphingopyxis flava]SKB79001.1 choline dehydrogenase [Sphingopyxis flava]